MSNLGKTSIISLEQGIKINTQYYRDHVLSVMRDMEGMRDISDEDYIFLQDGACAHFFAHF